MWYWSQEYHLIDKENVESFEISRLGSPILWFMSDREYDLLNKFRDILGRSNLENHHLGFLLAAPPPWSSMSLEHSFFIPYENLSHLVLEVEKIILWLIQDLHYSELFKGREEELASILSNPSFAWEDNHYESSSSYPYYCFSSLKKLFNIAISQNKMIIGFTVTLG
jgi:hypothetical protein